MSQTEGHIRFLFTSLQYMGDLWIGITSDHLTNFEIRLNLAILSIILLLLWLEMLPTCILKHWISTLFTNSNENNFWYWGGFFNCLYHFFNWRNISYSKLYCTSQRINSHENLVCTKRILFRLTFLQTRWKIKKVVKICCHFI